MRLKKENEKSWLERHTLDPSKVTLKVLESYLGNFGKAGIAYDSMDTLNASTGDILAIKGKRITVAKCSPLYPSDEGKGIIRIDGSGRYNAGIDLYDSVEVWKPERVSADKIEITPLRDVRTQISKKAFLALLDSGELTDFNLVDMPLSEGDHFVAPCYGYSIEFQVTQAIPAYAVIVSQQTEILFRY